MLKRTAVTALVLGLLTVPALAVESDGRFPQMVDLPTAHTIPRAAYTAGARMGPHGSFVGGIRIGITDYLNVGVSYGARNVIGTGELDWEDRVEFDFKVRLADEEDGVLGLAVGLDSRGYGDQRGDGTFEKASPGIFAVASKTLPFSEHWQGHAGISRTLELDRARPSLFAGVSGRFSQEFSVITEYQINVGDESGEASSEVGYLNAGLRWFLAERVQLDFMFRNLLGSEDSAELSSRSIAITFYDSF
jgi:hypothetical protein